MHMQPSCKLQVLFGLVLWDCFFVVVGFGLLFKLLHRAGSFLDLTGISFKQAVLKLRLNLMLGCSEVV